MRQLEKIGYIDSALSQLITRAYHFEAFNKQPNAVFFGEIQRTLGESVCVHWCFVFGKDTEGSHFKNFFKSSDYIGFSVEEVRERLWASIDMDPEEYLVFWTEVKTARDKFFAHRELGASANFPDIDKCRVQAEELRRILAEYSALRFENGPASESTDRWGDWVDFYSNVQLISDSKRKEREREFEEAMSKFARL